MMEVLLRAEHLVKEFPVKRGVVHAVSDVTFDILKGETLCVVGESGCGKSTLGRLLLRLIEPTSGKVIIGADEITALAPGALRQARRRMQMIFQDPYASLDPRMTVGQIIAEGLGVHGADGDPGEQVARIMAEVGLDPAMAGRYPHEFSGGQRQRIAIARAMILRPKVVVLDEPTSALDMTVQVQIVDLLRDLQRRYGLAYLFISHDLRVVRAMSHQVIVMRAGDVVEQGPSARVFGAPQTAYTRELMAAAFDLRAGSA